MPDHPTTIAEDTHGKEPDCTDCQQAQCFDAPSGSNFHNQWSADGARFIGIEFGERTAECRKRHREELKNVIS